MNGFLLVVLHGIEFRHGFYASLASKLSGQATKGMKSDLSRGFVSVMMGGVAAQASGGSFRSGAMSALTTWLYNDKGKPQPNKLSPKGRALLHQMEGGEHLKPYDDQTGKPIKSFVPGATIGYGHLIHPDKWHLYKDGITSAQAKDLFNKTIKPFESTVYNALSVKVSQQQFDAAVMLAYNIGEPVFIKSSALKLINNAKAVTRYSNLKNAWMAYNKSQGKVMNGLISRRQAEWDVYSRGIYEMW